MNTYLKCSIYHYSAVEDRNATKHTDLDKFRACLAFNSQSGKWSDVL